MIKKLVIVESPAKAKTIRKFLGKGFKVEASMGHVRDLPRKKSDLTVTQKKLSYASLGVDVENSYHPLYVVSEDKKKIIKKLKDLMTDDTELYIATDEDREGEAIGWHLVEILCKKESEKKKIKRIVFHEITKTAIVHAVENPRTIDQNLVDAQQTRRILDRLVGYKLSPLLWKKVRTGLSAGRVQSVAVRLIVDREREIRVFEKVESWTIVATLKNKKNSIFEATLSKINNKKAALKTEEETLKIVSDLKDCLYQVYKVTRKEVKRNPSAPFTTSTLQQEAARKLGFSVKKTMMVAQKLYEGVSLQGKDQTGLITYMRTDSVNLSNKALKDARETITNLYGKEYALSTPRAYKNKSKGAQEAHEAIRPTEMSRLPKDVKNDLSNDEYRLYEIIWKRTLATQMAQAILDSVAIDILASGGKKSKYILRANGKTIKFAGFMKVYVEGSDNPDKELENKEKLLPELNEKEAVDLEKLTPNQHFTKPPPRYTEAALVKKMEEEGIGRPSTYAPTITTIMNRGYIEKDGKSLIPTDVAFVVTDLLVKHFTKVVDYKFTANMEHDLDEIACGKKKWIPILDDFYHPFAKLVSQKDTEIKRADVISDTTDEVCEKCGQPMVVKLGRNGKFLSCLAYPTCKNARSLDKEEAAETDQKLEELSQKYKGEKCDKCGSMMVVKKGRFGYFLACEKYPECKSTKPIQSATGVKCPECKKGDIVERKTRKGKTFYSCNQFPKCKYALWKKPVKTPCQKCGGLQVIQKKDVLKCQKCELETAQQNEE